MKEISEENMKSKRLRITSCYIMDEQEPERMQDEEGV